MYFDHIFGKKSFTKSTSKSSQCLGWSQVAVNFFTYLECNFVHCVQMKYFLPG